MFLTRIHVYNYFKKVKIDISTIPIIFNEKNEYKSEVSDEIISNKDVIGKFKKTENGIALFAVSNIKNDLEKAERENLGIMLNYFGFRFWYKFSFKKALSKRVKNYNI